ncbi:MAG TPA: DUF4386 domain-containing protein [Candidatus Limnocylindrales bacterium]|nr:DUF4386 domain-containing protein [Candidatus Limnocylindrales bacterium]
MRKVGDMASNRTLARIAGLLYLVVGVGGGFGEYVRSSVRVAGDAAATAANVAGHVSLLRIGFVTDLVDFVCFLGVGLVLYRLLRSVDPGVAVAMLVINAVSVGIQALNMLNQVAALLVATQPGYTAGMSHEATQGLVLLLMDMQHQGYVIAQIFFGLYLLPLGYLVYRSHMFPRALGVLLAIGCGGYIAGVAADYLSPTFDSTLAVYFGILGGLAELAFLLWLLVFGTRKQTQGRHAASEMKGELA